MAVFRVYLVKSKVTGKQRLTEAFDKHHAKNKELIFFPGHSVSDLGAKLMYDKNKRYA